MKKLLCSLCYISVLLIAVPSWGQSRRLQNKIQAEFGPESVKLCQIGILLKSGQIRMVPSRFLSESECIWSAKMNLKDSKVDARKAFLSHGDFKKEISLKDIGR